MKPLIFMVMLVGLPTGTAAVAADGSDTAIRPFQVHVPEETLVDLRRRLAATGGPTRKRLRTNRRASSRRR
jgi:hypothetical protein